MQKEGQTITRFDEGDEVAIFTSRLGLRIGTLEEPAAEVLNAALALRAENKNWAYRSMETYVMLPDGDSVENLLAKAIIDWNEQGMENERGTGLA